MLSPPSNKIWSTANASILCPALIIHRTVIKLTAVIYVFISCMIQHTRPSLYPNYDFSLLWIIGNFNNIQSITLLHTFWNLNTELASQYYLASLIHPTFKLSLNTCSNFLWVNGEINGHKFLSVPIHLPMNFVSPSIKNTKHQSLLDVTYMWTHDTETTSRISRTH